ncbi:MAG TPA: methionine--tRNA ligase subunit beta, partial [Firmicutes bacterium]|nr:methionine--tRNA ligase subunit beta [Bacillota bacterium]
NADLANDLGNLLNRTLSMLNRYFNGVVPEPATNATDVDQALIDYANSLGGVVDTCLKEFKLNEALIKIWQLVGKANKYVDERAPWNLAKLEDTNELRSVMYNLVETLRIVALLIKPFLPETGERMWVQLGLTDLDSKGLGDARWGRLPVGTQTTKGDPIFPRLEVEKEEIPEVKPQVKKESAPIQEKPEGVLVNIEDFLKCELVVAEIVEAGPVEGADRLLKLQVDIGSEKRQIVAGIAKHYAPSDLVGKRIIVVRNLKPAKLRGELSEGMLLAATAPDGTLELVSVSDAIPAGSRVK